MGRGAGLAEKLVRYVVWRQSVTVFRSGGVLPSQARRLRIEAFSFAAITGAAALYPEYFHRRRLARFEERLQQGYACLLGRVGGAVAHLAWMHAGDTIAVAEAGEQAILRLGEQAIIITDCWTPPPLRGRGYYAEMIAAMAGAAAQQGLAAYIYCETANRASARGIRRAGFTPVALVQRNLWCGVAARRARLEGVAAELGAGDGVAAGVAAVGQ